MRRTLGVDAGEIGALDPAAIEEVFDESWPVVRDADELHDALLTLIVLPPIEEWSDFFQELARLRRATLVRHAGGEFWAPAERLTTVQCLYPQSHIEPVIPSFEKSAPEDPGAAATEVVRGWLESTGPTTSTALAARLGLPRELMDAALGRLESSGQVLRGRFTPSGIPESPEWCNRRL